MRDRRGELDVAHAVSPNFGHSHLDAAFFANDAAILHALVLTAQAFVIFDRPKDPSAEQPVALRLERPVIDRLGLLDLAIGPRADALRTGDRDSDLIEALRPADLAKDIHQLVHQRPLSVTNAVMSAKAGIHGDWIDPCPPGPPLPRGRQRTETLNRSAFGQ